MDYMGNPNLGLTFRSDLESFSRLFVAKLCPPGFGIHVRWDWD